VGVDDLYEATAAVPEISSGMRVPFALRFTHIGVPGNSSGPSLSLEAQEDVMSDDSIHLIITIGIIVLMFAWVPFVNIICPPGWRSAEKSSTEEEQGETRQKTPSVSSLSSLSSRRLADQSRNFLHALSARQEHKTPGSQANASRVPPGSNGKLGYPK
jgi:hypothetical protein